MNIRPDDSYQIESGITTNKDTSLQGSSVNSQGMERSSRMNPGNFSFGDTPRNTHKFPQSKTSESGKSTKSERLLERASIIEDKQQENECEQ